MDQASATPNCAGVEVPQGAPVLRLMLRLTNRGNAINQDVVTNAR